MNYGNFKYIDLFSGAGGLSLGFKQQNFSCTLAIEIDKWASETYQYNFPKTPVLVSDITTLDYSDLHEYKKDRVDVIVGGPPCQGFSHANTSYKDPKDPRNSLFIDYLQVVREFNPKICIIENVPGLLRTKLKDGTLAIEAICSEFSQAGYNVEWQILNAVNFGVPQNRERLFIIGIRSDLKTKFIWPESTHSCRGLNNQLDILEENNKLPWVSLWAAISDLPQVCAEDLPFLENYNSEPLNSYQKIMRQQSINFLENHEPMKHTKRIVERFSQIGFGQSEADVPEELKPRKRSGNGEISGKVYDQNSRRQLPNLPSNAIVASSHSNYIHPFLNRNFTVREMMRIQSFPDWFIAKGKRAVLSKKLSEKKGLFEDMYLDQRAQIGNAVPPLLANAVAKSVYKTLIKSSLETNDVQSS